MAKFSLREGVFDSLHIYVNPGKLPLGFTSGAQELALKTHQLPIPPDAMGLTNYVDILSQLVNFVANADSHDFPIFFTNGKEINDTKRVIDKISQEAGELDLDIKIYPIEELFFPLKQITVKMSNDQNNTTEQPFVNIFLAKDMIDRDTYMYTKNVGCKVRLLER